MNATVGMAQDVSSPAEASPWLLQMTRAVGLALAYLALALLALLIGGESLRAVPLWPAAGLALAALAVWGWRYWPAIWIGAFAAKLLGGMPLPLAALIAVGIAMQAVLGALLTRHLPPAAQPLARARGALAFFVLGGPIACLVSATVGVAALHFLGDLPASMLAAEWMTWWVGDSLGVLLAAPLVLLVLSESRLRWRDHALQGAGPLVILGVLVVGGYAWLSHVEQTGRHERLATTAGDLQHQVESAIHQRRERLLAIMTLFDSHKTITEREFAAFNQMAAGRTGVEIIEWAPRVVHAERAAFETAVQREGPAGFSLLEFDDGGALVPATARADYYPLRFAIPSRVEAPLGVDLGANPKQRAAMTEAVASARPALVARANFPGNMDGREWLLLMPVYRAGFNASVADQAARRAALRGFVIAVFAPDVLWADVAVHAAREGLVIRITGLANWNSQRLMLNGAVPADREARPDWSGRIGGLAGEGLRVDAWMLPTWRPGQSTGGRFYFAGKLLLVLFTGVFVFAIADHTRRMAREVALRTASEGRLAALIENVPVGVMVHDRQAVVVSVNPTAEGLLQRAAADLVGHGTRDPGWHFLREDGSRMAVDEYPGNQVLSTRQTVRDRVVGLVFPHGRGICWMLVSAAPIFDAQHELSEVAVTLMDITERRQLEARERNRAGIMELLGTSVPLAAILERIVGFVEAEDAQALCSILLLDEAGTRLRHGAAPSLPDSFNHAIDGLEIGPAGGPCGTAAFTRQRVIAADIDSHPDWVDFRALVAQGGLRSCWSEPILNAVGGVLGTFTIYHREPCEPCAADIELIVMAASLARLAIERKRAEAEILQLNADLERRVTERTAQLKETSDRLSESAARIAAILDTVVDGVITTDEHGTVETFNPAAERIFGYMVGEVIGRNIKMLMPEPYHGEHDGYLARYMATGEAHIIGIGREVEGRRKDGTSFPLELAINEMWLGAVRHFTGVMRDITERQRAEAVVQEARNAAEAANRAKSDFLAAMSHEIRTPMNGVIGMVDVLHQTSLNGYQVEMVDIIRDSAFSLLGIIEDILDFSKIEAGKLEVEQEPMAVAEVVEKACGMLDHLAVSKGVELTLFTDPAIPAHVLGDAQRLRQIIVNLANNAIKFSSGQGRIGRVSVRALLVRREEARVVVEIRVVDNGIGIDRATQARLFAAFTQAETSTTRRFGGTGLGLVIARNLVRLMGGELTVQSAPDEGSTFCARLPCVPLPAATDTETGAASSPLAGLACLAVGAADSLADDLAAWLAAAGAGVERSHDLAAARAFLALATTGPWLCLIDAGNVPPSLDELRAIADLRAQSETRFLVISRGLRRRLGHRDADSTLFELDGNVLTRQSFLDAVAVATGRATEKPSEPARGRSEAALIPPPRDVAVRQGRLILVAEDNETNQQVIVRQLALLGFAADVAANGREALTRWQGGDYALLLSDLHMPQMDGYELTAAIRAAEIENPGGRRMPIIALTANALKGEAVRCVEAGMDDYLSKPTPLAELKTTLEKWLPMSATATPPASAAVPPAPTSVPVDVAVLAALVGDDPAVIREFLLDFRASATSIAAELSIACTAGQSAQVTGLAHKLKSSARSVGALALGERCAELEAAGKAGQVAALSDPWQRFAAEMAVVEEYLDSL